MFLHVFPKCKALSLIQGFTLGYTRFPHEELANLKLGTPNVSLCVNKSKLSVYQRTCLQNKQIWWTGSQLLNELRH